MAVVLGRCSLVELLPGTAARKRLTWVVAQRVHKKMCLRLEAVVHKGYEQVH